MGVTLTLRQRDTGRGQLWRRSQWPSGCPAFVDLAPVSGDLVRVVCGLK